MEVLSRFLPPFLPPQLTFFISPPTPTLFQAKAKQQISEASTAVQDSLPTSEAAQAPKEGWGEAVAFQENFLDTTLNGARLEDVL